MGNEYRIDNDREQLRMSCQWATRLDDALFEWAFQLFKTNMREMYAISQDGYDEKTKRAEMRASTSRYLIVSRGIDGQPIAFAHFRFDIDFEATVIYCYELQVDGDHQSKGIGTMLIDVLYRIGRMAGMEKLMATVFAFNDKSLGFFHKAGFITDSSCPEPEQDKDYLILSKAC